MSKSPRSLCVSFSRTGWCIYHLFIWWNLNFLHISQLITLPTQSCVVLYFFRANLLYSLIMWLIDSSLSLHNIIIIIMSRRLRGYPWPSLAISPYHSSPPAGLQGYIPCPHIAAVCKFVLVVPLLHIHVWGSTGVHRLWARPCFSSSVLRVWFVELV